MLAVAGALPVAVAVAALKANGPDPFVQALADGCARDREALVRQNAPSWAYVNDKDYPAEGPPPPPRWVKGVVDAAGARDLAAHPSGGDNPFSHRSYDFVINILPDLEFSNLLAGTPEGRTGNYAGVGEQAGRLHTERELASLPTFARPQLGDRVSQLGSWVWDCDHAASGERSEFHPYRALWVERNPRPSRGGASPRSPWGEAEGDLYISTEGTPAALHANCAHRTKGDEDAFKRCLRSSSSLVGVTGQYVFTLRAPRRPRPTARLRARVVDRGSVSAPPVIVKTSGNTATVSLTVAMSVGMRVILAKQVFVGWDPMPARALPEHLRVRFDRLLVHRAMDPSCPAERPHCPARVQTLRPGQIAAAPGEWNVSWNVNGIWGEWKPRALLARDGQAFRGSQSVDLYVDRDDRWRLLVIARECDFGALGSFDGQNAPLSPCPSTNEIGHPSGDDYPGALTAGPWLPLRSVGKHVRNAVVAGSSCPPVNAQGCYSLSFAVTRIEDAKVRSGRR